MGKTSKHDSNMEDGTKTKIRYRSKWRWQPNLGTIGTWLPARREATESADGNGKKRTWKYYLAIILLIVSLAFIVKGIFGWEWPFEMGSQFKVMNDPAPAEEGTVCDLFRELEEEGSSLLDDPNKQVIYEDHSISEEGVETKIKVTTFGSESAIGGPAEVPSEFRTRYDVANINLDELIHFEALTQGRARLIFADGNCDIYDMGAVLRLVKERDECHLFQAVPFLGQNYEYFNIMYTEAFEKIKCEEGIFYRARLDISKARCPAVHSLMNCGTDFFSAHIYNKLRRRLEFMDPNNSYKYQREYDLYPCKCVETEDGSLEATLNNDGSSETTLNEEGPTDVLVIDEDMDVDGFLEGLRIDTIR